jgi:hypothetical protein
MRALDRARSLLRSNFGRRDGWFVEFRGAVVGELEEAERVEQFWDSYVVRCAPDSTDLLLRNDDLWNRCAFIFRNRRTHESARHAFPGRGAPFVRDGRVHMRGLYLVPESALERACLEVLEFLGPRSYRSP